MLVALIVIALILLYALCGYVIGTARMAHREEHEVAERYYELMSEGSDR